MKKLFMVLPLVLLLCLTFSCQKAEEVAEEPVVDVEATEEREEPLNIEGVILTYSIDGTGVPCVFFSGGENIGLNLLSNELKKYLKFIHADPKDVTKENAKSLTLDTILEDIDKVRIALGVEKIAVMGHSMFSVIPPAYALKYPEHASHLIITGGMPSISEKSDKASNEYWEKEASEERKEILRRNTEALTEDVMSKLSPGDSFIRFYVANTPRLFYNPEHDLTELWEGVEFNTDFSDRYWELIYGMDNTDKFHLIKAPTIVFSGRYDFWAPYFLWDDVKDKIPDLTFVLFENAGHNPMFEIPEEFDKKLIDWIGSH